MQFIYQQKFDSRLTASDTGGGGGPVLGTVTSNGACQGISMWWIIKRSLADDFWTWFGPPKSAAPTGAGNGKPGEPVTVIKEVMSAQKLLTDPEPDGDFAVSSNVRKMNHDAAANYIVAKSNNGLVKQAELWQLGGPVAWDQLAEAATVRPGYAFIGWVMQGWGGHAVAAHILPNGSIEWMDPNIGEVEKANTQALKQWFATACSGSGGTYGSAPLTKAEIQLLTPTRPDGTLPPASKKLHDM